MNAELGVDGSDFLDVPEVPPRLAGRAPSGPGTAFLVAAFGTTAAST
jgi:hypothetical protein